MKGKGGLGFRDNWKLSTLRCLQSKDGGSSVEEDSLLYKVFKAKYFPNSSFLEAQPNQISSWAWQSILASREIITSGCMAVEGWKWGKH